MSLLPRRRHGCRWRPPAHIDLEMCVGISLAAIVPGTRQAPGQIRRRTDTRRRAHPGTSASSPAHRYRPAESFRRKSRSCRRRSPRRVRRQHRRGSPLSPRREMQRQIMPISMAVNRAGAVVHVAILAGGRILAATPTMRMSRSRTSDKHQSHYQPRHFPLPVVDFSSGGSAFGTLCRFHDRLSVIVRKITARSPRSVSASRCAAGPACLRKTAIAATGEHRVVGWPGRARFRMDRRRRSWPVGAAPSMTSCRPRQGRSCQDQYDERRWEAGIQPEYVKKVLLSERRSHYQ